jgi:hypothetical protein
MITQVSFTTDQYLKDQALEKAKQEGITLKTLFIYTMKSFVDGKISLGIEVNEKEPEIEEIVFADKSLNVKAAKLAKLLK